jgi:hypothetical protein
MIIKVQSILFPYVRHIEIKKANIVSKSDRITADRIMLALLFGVTVVASILFS